MLNLGPSPQTLEFDVRQRDHVEIETLELLCHAYEASKLPFPQSLVAMFTIVPEHS